MKRVIHADSFLEYTWITRWLNTIIIASISAVTTAITFNDFPVRIIVVSTIPLQSLRVAVEAMFPTLRASAGLVLVADDVVHHYDLARQEAP